MLVHTPKANRPRVVHWLAAFTTGPLRVLISLLQGYDTDPGTPYVSEQGTESDSLSSGPMSPIVSCRCMELLLPDTVEYRMISFATTFRQV